jgi:hypothetical protein
MSPKAITRTNRCRREGEEREKEKRDNITAVIYYF